MRYMQYKPGVSARHTGSTMRYVGGSKVPHGFQLVRCQARLPFGTFSILLFLSHSSDIYTHECAPPTFAPHGHAHPGARQGEAVDVESHTKRELRTRERAELRV